MSSLGHSEVLVSKTWRDGTQNTFFVLPDSRSGGPSWGQRGVSDRHKRHHWCICGLYWAARAYINSPKQPGSLVKSLDQPNVT